MGEGVKYIKTAQPCGYAVVGLGLNVFEEDDSYTVAALVAPSRFLSFANIFLYGPL